MIEGLGTYGGMIVVPGSTKHFEEECVSFTFLRVSVILLTFLYVKKLSLLFFNSGVDKMVSLNFLGESDLSESMLSA